MKSGSRNKSLFLPTARLYVTKTFQRDRAPKAMPRNPGRYPMLYPSPNINLIKGFENKNKSIITAAAIINV